MLVQRENVREKDSFDSVDVNYTSRSEVRGLGGGILESDCLCVLKILSWDNQTRFFIRGICLKITNVTREVHIKWFHMGYFASNCLSEFYLQGDSTVFISTTVCMPAS